MRGQALFTVDTKVMVDLLLQGTGLTSLANESEPGRPAIHSVGVVSPDACGHRSPFH